MEIRYKVPKELESSLRNINEAEIARLLTDVLTIVCSTKRRGTLNTNLENIKRTGHSLEKGVDSNYQLLQTIISNQSKILAHLEGYIESPTPIEPVIQPIIDDGDFEFDDDDITY
jgi:hypothetical protein